MKYVLSIDLGTTGNRAIIFDKDQKVLAKAYQEFTQIFPKPGWVEHKPDEIWKTTVNVIKKALKQAKLSASDISTAGITNQRETVMIWNKNTGKPIYNAIVWQCRRTSDYCKSLRKKYEKTVHKRTGLTIDAYFSASKLHWLLNKFPYKKDYICGTVDTWILWNLTKGASHATDYSNASRTLLFNIRSGKWDRKLLKIFKVPKAMLPKVKASNAHFGDIDASLFGAPIPIHGILGDQQAAMFAQGCYQPGIYKNTYGTGCFLMTNIGKKPLYSKNNLLTTIAWKMDKKTEYALEGSIFMAGAAVQWLRDGIKIIKSAKETTGAMKRLKDNEGVYFVPALVGLGAPHWDMEARGTILGITRGTNRDHFVRATLEAICYQSRDVLMAMNEDACKNKSVCQKIQALQVDGGASVNDTMMQFQADLLGVPVIRPEIIETTALGAAYMAGLGAGIWKSKESVLKKRKIDKIFKPNRSKTKEMNDYYVKWLDAVNRAKHWA